MNKQFSLPLISVVAVILFFTGACLPAAAETRLSEEDINEFKVYGTPLPTSSAPKGLSKN